MGFNDKNSNQSGGFSWRSLISKLTGDRSGQDFLNSRQEQKSALGNYSQVFSQENGKRKDAYSPVIMQPSPADDLSARVEKRTGSAWKSPQILKTNLMQMEEAVSIDWQGKIKLLILNVLLAALVIAAAYAGLLFWETEQYIAQTQIRAEIAILDEQISALTRNIENADIFRRKVKLAGQLLKRHIYWTNFFTFLEENTLANVKYQGNFSGDTGGQYAFTATVDSYDMVYQQVKAFSGNDMVSSVKVNSASLSAANNQTNVQFGIELGLKPELFNK